MKRVPKRASTGAPRQSAGQSNPLLEARGKLAEAEQLRRAGKLAKAQKHCEAIVKRYPDYAAAQHTLGLVLADKREYAKALTHLVQASMLNPKDWTTLTALAGVYLRLGAGPLAARTLEQARQLKPDDAAILATLGEIYREEREYALARDAFQEALALDSSLTGAHLGLGQCCGHLGEPEAAAKAFETLLNKGSRSVSVLYFLSQLPSSFVSKDVLALAEEAVADPKQDRQEFEASVALTRAAALDAAGRPEEAWDHLVAANGALASRLARERLQERNTEQVVLAGVKNHATSKTHRSDTPSDHPLSVFILGPSRSGKTTLERLAASLEGVKRGYENPILEYAVRQTFQTAGLPPRSRVIELPPTLDGTFRGHYLEELKRRAADARVFTNTHPVHIQEVLRLASILTDARFVFIKRDIDDITLRIFMTKYLSGNAYGYALDSIRDHVSWYNDMIDTLAEKLPRSTLTIQYEAMASDPGSTVSKFAELCGLAVPAGAVPELGYDVGCAQAYRDKMVAAPSTSGQ